MKENLDIFSSNLINKDINNNIVFDSNIKKLQQNLFLMGFDIIQINKIITYFNITSESEALDYLIKGEDGMWNHPFVPKEKVILDDDNSLLNPTKSVMNNVYTKIKKSSINNEIANRKVNFNPWNNFMMNELSQFPNIVCIIKLALYAIADLILTLIALKKYLILFLTSINIYTSHSFHI